MSRGSRALLAFGLLLLAMGLAAAALTGRVTGSLPLAWLVVLAAASGCASCLPGRHTMVTQRVWAAVVVGLCVAFVLGAWHQPGQRWRAVGCLLCFGLPAAYVLVKGELWCYRPALGPRGLPPWIDDM